MSTGAEAGKASPIGLADDYYWLFWCGRRPCDVLLGFALASGGPFKDAELELLQPLDPHPRLLSYLIPRGMARAGPSVDTSVDKCG